MYVNIFSSPDVASLADTVFSYIYIIFSSPNVASLSGTVYS